MTKTTIKETTNSRGERIIETTKICGKTRVKLIKTFENDGDIDYLIINYENDNHKSTFNITRSSRDIVYVGLDSNYKLSYYKLSKIKH